MIAAETPAASATFRPRAVGKIGGFTGIADLNKKIGATLILHGGIARHNAIAEGINQHFKGFVTLPSATKYRDPTLR